MNTFDIFSVLTLLGGVAFFLFGMSVMSTGLEKMSGGHLERTLKRATSSRFRGLALGAGITVAIQSSSAMTVMLVGLVNSGIMQLHQTVYVIMGSNIGTTLTAWVLSLAGIGSGSFLLRLLNPDGFAPVFAAVGIVFIMASRSSRRRDIGEVLIGFSVLMFGMMVMKGAVSGLEDNAGFAKLLILFKNPLLGILAGAVFTGIIQSSAASVGVLQTLAATVGVSYGAAIPIILGQNIGTCVTALLSSVGVTKNARRVAVVHIYFNIIGTILYTVVLYSLDAVAGFRFLDDNVSALGIAVVHSVFNVTMTAVLLPFPRLLEKLAVMTVREKPDSKQDYVLLDERLLNTPAFAIAQCQDLVVQMADTARGSVKRVIEMVGGGYDAKAAASVRASEQQLDMYEDKLGEYLVKLSARELADSDSREVSKLLYVIGDFERLGDHAINILQSVEEIVDKKIEFSGGALKELRVAQKALTEIVDMAVDAFVNDDPVMSRRVEPLEQVIDELVASMRARHISRLQRGECEIAPGFVWSDLLINYERISDHCSNIAVRVIQTDIETPGRHVYLSQTRSADNEEFMSLFGAYMKKYRLQ
ncbi:MAG: Na/Pi cotransporter family protein [Oscillospiraceae bacterium]|jgi:phosphate:Na+ symporter|nr:Na/Pi cotransporter family protein [Oscillospiraceae bacterium]